MTEKQEHLLQLFRELDEICKKNNLRYVMAGGTAIGVVRNEDLFPGMMMQILSLHVISLKHLKK